ncbi:MAG: hypothetical protein ABIG11_05890 [bacterium]
MKENKENREGETVEEILAELNELLNRMPAILADISIPETSLPEFKEPPVPEEPAPCDDVFKAEDAGIAQFPESQVQAEPGIRPVGEEQIKELEIPDMETLAKDLKSSIVESAVSSETGDVPPMEGAAEKPESLSEVRPFEEEIQPEAADPGAVPSEVESEGAAGDVPPQADLRPRSSAEGASAQTGEGGEISGAFETVRSGPSEIPAEAAETVQPAVGALSEEGVHVAGPEETMREQGIEPFSFDAEQLRQDDGTLHGVAGTVAGLPLPDSRQAGGQGQSPDSTARLSRDAEQQMLQEHEIGEPQERSSAESAQDGDFLSAGFSPQAPGGSLEENIMGPGSSVVPPLEIEKFPSMELAGEARETSHAAEEKTVIIAPQEEATVMMSPEEAPSVTQRASLDELASKAVPEGIPPEQVRSLGFLYAIGEGHLCAGFLAAIDDICSKAVKRPLFVKRAFVRVFEEETRGAAVVDFCAETAAMGVVCLGSIPEGAVREVEKSLMTANLFLKHVTVEEAPQRSSAVDLMADIILR